MVYIVTCRYLAELVQTRLSMWKQVRVLLSGVQLGLHCDSLVHVHRFILLMDTQRIEIDLGIEADCDWSLQLSLRFGLEQQG